MLDVNYQTSLLPQSEERALEGWKGMLSISELTHAFARKYGALRPGQVMDFMVRDADNPSSILSCLRAARENARAVRGTLTTEVWETQNHTWLQFNQLLRERDFQRDPSALFEWVKFRSHLSRGVTVGTMLQDESLHFLRIGTFLERADNTARLVDVKFQPLSRADNGEGGMRQAQSMNGMRQLQMQPMRPGHDPADDVADQPESDFYHWSAVLRSVSGFEVYRKVYRNVIRPEKVAELLILRADMPRSLAACIGEVVSNLKHVANEQSDETLRRAGRLDADLRFSRIDEILSTGLHAYLTQFLDRVSDLGAGISRDFLVPVAA
jgi:uncharacterized alpha-E superfamily protein